MKIYQTKRALLPVIFLLVGLILSACTSLSLGQPQPTSTPLAVETDNGMLTAEGSLVPANSTKLGFLASGKLDEILVSAGQKVKKGDVLAKLGDRDVLEAALSQAKLEQLSAQQAYDDLFRHADLMKYQSAQALVEAQANLIAATKALNDLDTPDFQKELDDRNQAIEDAKADLDAAGVKLDKVRDRDTDDQDRKDAQDEYDDANLAYKDAIYDRNIWQNGLDSARAAVDLAQARLNFARQDCDANQNGPDADDLALAQSRLDNAGSHVAAAEKALDETGLSAPYDATVASVSDLDAGEYLLPGMIVVTLVDESYWMVETTDLSELDVVEVSVGQRVTAIPDALPNLKLSGEVTSIDRIFSISRGDIVYTVHIRMEGSDPNLRWGMTMMVTFE